MKRAFTNSTIQSTSKRVCTGDTLHDIIAQLPKSNGQTTNHFMVTCVDIGATSQVAEAVFKNDPNVTHVHIQGVHVAVDLQQDQRINSGAKRLNNLVPGAVRDIVAIQRKTWKSMLASEASEWLTAHSRVVTPPALDHKPGFHRSFNNGRPVYHGVGNMLNTLIGNCKRRFNERKWQLDYMALLRKLGDAFTNVFDAQVAIGVREDERVLCQCGNCDKFLDLFGPHVVSPDRSDDSKSYTEDGQVVTIISAAHNTRVKKTAVPELRAIPDSWLKRTAINMGQSTERRIATRRKKIDKTAADIAMLKRYNDECAAGSQTFAAFSALLLRLKGASPECARCGAVLYYGNERGLLTHTKVWQQASPDRLNSATDFYSEGNVRIVCQACQHVDQHRDSINRAQPHSGDVVPLVMSHRFEIAADLQMRYRKEEARLHNKNV